MPSFDVVSRLDFQEIDNAIGNALREIGNRYDFKGSNTTIDHKDKVLTVVTDDELKLKQVHDLIITHLVRRKVDPLCLSFENKEKAGSNKIRQTYKLVEGIEQTIQWVKNNWDAINRDAEFPQGMSSAVKNYVLLQEQDKA